MNLNKYLTVASSLASNSSMIMQRLKSSKLVEQLTPSSSDNCSPVSKSGLSEKSFSTATVSPLSLTVTPAPPLIAVQPVFVQNPRISLVDNEWYKQDQNQSSYSARKLRPSDLNLYENAIKDDGYISQSSDVGVGKLV